MIYFGYYLVERGLITTAQVIEALDMQRRSQRPVGEVARSLGLMSDEQVLTVLDRQGQETPRKPFGQLAIELGFVTQEQLITIIENQAAHRRPLGEVLVEMGAIDHATMERELQTFLNHSY
ncbi:MAG: hypothetical protein H6707_20660 [Deltaproteobacteria bacterium]|nr:hypothetical protein [Deltaproteobacteria bacterium]